LTRHYPMTKSPHQIGVLYGIVLLSGFAGLGYEMVWTRMLTVGLGHEVPAVLAVVAAFFSGMALGAYSLDEIVSRSGCPGGGMRLWNWPSASGRWF
jgi:spermidine synthase